MKKLWGFIVLLLLPVLACADSSLSFAPPPSDYSVVFLGNLFGIVDGVLHGTGSQIMGVMFGVFNAAVLALGGIIVMYTLMVSTMNTAHEGQMLGQKWSSIWIPVRTTLGLALLVPKASGYCLMQIFVMWIVVQGVGAADKVWEAALSYLNRGGVIIKAQANPGTALTLSEETGIPSAASTILAGQVCMIGLENQIKKQKRLYEKQKADGRGACYGTLSEKMTEFCNTAVPDLVGTVNMVEAQNLMAEADSYRVPMPHVKSGPYMALNGICGLITWNKLDKLSAITNPGTGGGKTSLGGQDKTVDMLAGVSGALNILGTTIDPRAALGAALSGNTTYTEKHGIKLSAAELETAQMSRAIAIQQMYLDLSLVAQVMVNNSPDLSSNNLTSTTGKQQFGVPYTADDTLCTVRTDGCTAWGPVPTGSTTTTAVILNGTEFQGAIADYNGIMQPTLNLIKQMADTKNAGAAQAFIQQANAQGWIMAGSYFFDLVKLNGNAATGDLTDTNTGLSGSTYDPASLTAGFKGTGCDEGNLYEKLCVWFDKNPENLKQVRTLVDGAIPDSSSTETVIKPEFSKTANEGRKVVSGPTSSTVYGYVNNAMMILMPGQPGLAPLQFANLIKFSVDTTAYRLKEQDFDCGRVRITFFSFCLGQMFGELFYNIILLNMYNFFMAIFQQIIQQVIMAFLMIPIQGMADIFKLGVKTISEPGANPVVALANMGVMYINFSANLWMMLLTLSVTSSLIPIFGIFIFALIALAMPLLLAWVGIMTSIGFTTAYYVPILPYMIFTFGSIAWLISVIEAMVAAPIVALGVTHPEGHDAFGKGEAAIMILMNVFLRPAMMIIGYISAISLSYVGVWILNAGFDHAIGFIQGGASIDRSGDWRMETSGYDADYDKANNSTTGKEEGQGNYDYWNKNSGNLASKDAEGNALDGAGGSGSGGYSDWAGVYAFFFSILIYTTMYLTLVQKAFTLITYLPDKVLRWIGGSPESIGQEASQWGEEVKSASKEAGGKTLDAQGQMGKQLGGMGQKALSKGMDAGGKAGGGGGKVKGTGDGNATPSGSDADDAEGAAKDAAAEESAKDAASGMV